MFGTRTDNARLCPFSKHNFLMRLWRGGKIINRLVDGRYVVNGVVNFRKLESTVSYRSRSGVLPGTLECYLRVRVVDIGQRKKRPIGLVLRLLFCPI